MLFTASTQGNSHCFSSCQLSNPMIFVFLDLLCNVQLRASYLRNTASTKAKSFLHDEKNVYIIHECLCLLPNRTHLDTCCYCLITPHQWFHVNMNSTTDNGSPCLSPWIILTVTPSKTWITVIPSLRINLIVSMKLSLKPIAAMILAMYPT